MKLGTVSKQAAATSPPPPRPAISYLTTEVTDRKLLVAYFGGGAKTGKLFCTMDPWTEDFKPPGDVA